MTINNNHQPLTEPTFNPHEQLIEEFYAAFASAEAETMASCYHPQAEFRDPIFGTLHGSDIAEMWRMLISRSNGRLRILFSDIKADTQTGSANWIATYEFSRTGRQIENRIHATFTFEDGLIKTHLDDFDFYKWNKQAFGFKGWLLGKTTFMQEAVRKQARAGLAKWKEKHTK